MMYFSDEARMSAIAKIQELNEKVGKISGKELDYLSARQIGVFLNMLKDEIIKESKISK